MGSGDDRWVGQAHMILGLIKYVRGGLRTGEAREGFLGFVGCQRTRAVVQCRSSPSSWVRGGDF